MKLKLFLASVLVAGLMNAQVAGDYDTSFGTNGRIIVSGETNPSKLSFSKMAFQPDGKILVITNGAMSGNQFNISRYLPNGTKDTGFGTNGSVNVAFGAYTAVAEELVLQDDGKILIGGTVYPLLNNPESHCGIVRLNANGTPDNTFGDMGRTTFLYESRSAPRDGINKIVVQPDGKIITGGRSSNGNDSRFAVARLNADGTPDIGFGTNGKLVKLFNTGMTSSVNNIKLLTNGNIWLAGNVGDYFGLVKLLPNGTYDTSFNTTGSKLAVSNVTGSDSTSTFFPDNSMMFAGATNTGHSLYYKFNADLQPEATFGTAGQLSVNMTPNTLEISVEKVVLDGNGRIFGIGRSRLPGNNVATSVICLTSNGTLDNSFSDDGKLMVNHGYAINSSSDAVLQTDQKLLISGFLANDNSASNGHLTRVHTQMSVLGTNDIKKTAEFAVYPNPAKDMVTISHLDKSLLNQNIEVLDSMGRLVLKQPVQGENEKINIAHLNAGVYYIKIGNQINKKVIKK